MTVYKPVKLLAAKAAEMTLQLANKQKLTGLTGTIDNGKIKVPSVLLDPIPVTKDNLVSTVVVDGFQKMEDVYKDVPKDQWPKQK
jgi:D-xylose transport system substrate-binding protein